MNKANLRNWRLRSAIARSAVAVATVIALALFELAYANVTVFHDRAAFNAALDTNPLLIKKVEGWDTYPPRTIFPNGSTVNGITYFVSAGEALVVNTGISLSPPNNLFQTVDFGFRPLIDTFTFVFNLPINAFGITFSSTFANHDGDYLLTTDLGDVIPSFFDPLFPGFSLGQFAGFISDEPFRSVTISSTANALYGMDDLIFAVGEPFPKVNDRVSFRPRPETFSTTPSSTACPGFTGTFRFDATLTNESKLPLRNLFIKVVTLSNGNLLQNADGGPRGTGAIMAVPFKDGFLAPSLYPQESIDVPFVICLRETTLFTFLVDVLGTFEETSLVSVNQLGTASGNDDSGTRHILNDVPQQPPAISADGRFIAFVSEASDLVANDTNGHSDIFVRDLQSGTTTLVSVNQAGTASGNGFSENPLISADGRFVAFVSEASDLVASDTNGQPDVFLRDLQTGTTALVSINLAGTDSGNDRSLIPAISADGRFVAFVSEASDLVAKSDTNNTFDVFVRDLQTGTTTLVGVNQAGTATANRGSFAPLAISANGRFVAFTTFSSDLVATDTNEASDVFVRDLQAGITTLVSVNSAGTDSGKGIDPFFGGPTGSSNPTLSSNGRFVAFQSGNTDLVETNDTNETSDVFVRDMQTGVTTLVSVNTTGNDSGKSIGKPGTGGSLNPVLSADGRFVAFVSNAIDLVPNDASSTGDVFMRDLQTGSTTLVSVNRFGTAGGNGSSGSPVISADGRFVAFVSQASDLVANDTNGETDVFVRDLQAGTTALVSGNQAGTATGNGRSEFPVINGDGRFVGFLSRASDLVANDNNDRRDVFVRPVP